MYSNQQALGLARRISTALQKKLQIIRRRRSSLIARMKWSTFSLLFWFATPYIDLTSSSTVASNQNMEGTFCCPRVSWPDEEVYVSSGSNFTFQFRVYPSTKSVSTDYKCQFTVEGRTTQVEARVMEDNTISCDPVTLSYESDSATAAVSFVGMWGENLPLDNSESIQIVLYKCPHMASACTTCASFHERYKCGWCYELGQCVLYDDCSDGLSHWLHKADYCDKKLI